MEPAAKSTDTPLGVACTLCGAAPVRPLFTKQAIPYHACPACHFVFSRPATNANFETGLDDYEPSYLDYLESSDEDDANHAALLRFTERYRPLRGERVLDVGAGSGKLVRYLRGREIDAFGLEPAHALYERYLASEPFFFEKTVEELAQDAAERFGMVYACDVLEHVPDPQPFLAAIARVLAPGGALLVSTPDVASGFARLCGRRWHYFNKYHLSYFSKTTLEATALPLGLRPVGFDRLPRWKSVGYLLQYASDFVLGGGRANVPRRLRRMVVPVNLHDTMYAMFERT